MNEDRVVQVMTRAEDVYICSDFNFNSELYLSSTCPHFLLCSFYTRYESAHPPSRLLKLVLTKRWRQSCLLSSTYSRSNESVLKQHHRKATEHPGWREISLLESLFQHLLATFVKTDFILKRKKKTQFKVSPSSIHRTRDISEKCCDSWSWLWYDSPCHRIYSMVVLGSSVWGFSEAFICFRRDETLSPSSRAMAFSTVPVNDVSVPVCVAGG